jgi:PAS domain-containing protein
MDLRLTVAVIRGSLLVSWAYVHGQLFQDQSGFEGAALDPADLLGSTDMQSRRGMSFFSALYNLEHGSSEGLRSSLTTPVLEENFCIYEETEGAQSKGELSLPRALSAIFWDMYSVRFQRGVDQLNGTAFCHLDSLAVGIPAAIDSVISELRGIAASTNDALFNEKWLIAGLGLVGLFVLCLPVIAAPHIVLRLATRRLLAALQEVPRPGADSATRALMEGIADLSDASQTSLPQDAQQQLWGRMLSWRVLFLLLFLTAAALQTIPAHILTNAGSTVVAEMGLMASGSPRQPLCIEVWSDVVAGLVRDAEWLPYMPTADLSGTIATLLELDEIYQSDVLSVSEQFGAVEYRRSDEGCETISCWGEIPSLSEFISLAEAISSSGFWFDSEEFRTFMEITFLEVDPALTDMRALDQSLCEEALSRGYALSVSLSLIAAVVVATAFLIHSRFLSGGRSRLRAAVALLRQVPPPWIAETRALVEFFIPQVPEEPPDSQSIAQLIAAALSTPTLCLGEGLMVEWANPAFQATFELQPETVVGRHLDALIPRALRPSLETWDDGEGRLYERLAEVASGGLDELHCNTKLVAGGKNVAVSLTAFTAPGAGVVLFVVSRAEGEIADAKFAAARRHAENLQSQLIPREFARQADGPFLVDSATLVGVSIEGIHELVRHDFREFGLVIAMVESSVRRNPPFTMLRPVGGYIVAAGGLFLGEGARPIEHALPAVALARAIKAELREKLPRREGRRFSIAIAIAGPLLCEVAEEAFEVSGRGFRALSEMLLRAPPDGILVSDEFRRSVDEIADAQFAAGPLVVGAETHVLSG